VGCIDPYTCDVDGIVNESVGLDRNEEIWLGRFPGLGSIEVHPDGRIEVSVESSHEVCSDSVSPSSEKDEKYQALLHGWGEPLSLARRGFVLAQGCAAVAPDSDEAILISGDAHDTAILALGLASSGWRILADRVVPLVFHKDRIEAHPRVSPIIASKRRTAKTEFEARPLRSTSNAVSVDVPRAGTPSSVVTIVSVRIRRPQEPVLEILTGHDRFDSARTVLVGGVLALPSTTSQESMARTLQMATLPVVSVRLDAKSPEADIAELLTWWSSR
jgi:hypothetical protein